MANFNWHGALCSTHKSCTHGHMSWEKGGAKWELVSAPWTSFRRFSHVLWSKAHNHRLLRACLPGSKRKLPPPAWQTRLELPSVVCCLRGMQFPGNVYICNQGHLSSAWAHCISYAPRQTMKLCPQSEGTLPSQMSATARSWIMEGPIFTCFSYHLHHYAWWACALPAFIWKIAFLTISMVIGIGGPSTGDSSDRWFGSQLNSALRSLW